MNRSQKIRAGGLLLAALAVTAGTAVRGQEAPRVGTARPTAASAGSPGFRFLEEPTRLVNQRLADMWRKNRLTPAERCDDYEFIRRASLDIIGRIPTVEEIEAYLKLPADNRRALLVDQLLASPEYARTWSTLWSHWLMTRSGGNPIYRAQLQLWLEERFSQPTMSYQEMVHDLLTATGRSNENGAIQFPISFLGEAQRDRAKDGQFDAVPLTARITRVFLGYQIQCAQCHCHPFNPEWTQERFWGTNAFLRQVERVGAPPNPQGNNQANQAPVLELRDNAGLNRDAIVYYEKRTGVFMATLPVFLDGRKPSPGSKLSRREELARMILTHEVKDAENKPHQQLARAFVNRMWGQFFGRSLNVKGTVDDFGEHNELVHEELLNGLADQFAGTGAYNPRQLIRWISASDAYNLKATANPSNVSAEAEVFFSRMPLKALSPEQLLESLITASRTPAAEQRAFRQSWLDKLVQNFGTDEGSEAVYSGTMLQTLLMMNSQEIQRAIDRNAGVVGRAMAMPNPRRTLDHLFLSTLSRPASEREYNQIVRQLPLRNLKEPSGPGPLQDVLWALLNSGEFILNH